MKKAAKLDNDDIQEIVTKLLVDAKNYNDEQSNFRAKATEYWGGAKFGNEEEGRSQIVLTELRDAVSGMTPDIMRVFTAGDRPVEFTPGSEQAAPKVSQITDYVNKKLEVGGYFIALHTAVHDALIRRLGIMKWWWDEEARVENYEIEGVTEEALQFLTADDDNTITSVTKHDDDDDDDKGLSDVEFTRKSTKGCAKFCAVPPEEFLTSRGARTISDALCVAHSLPMTRGELIALGVDEDDIEEHDQPDEADKSNSLDEAARRLITSNDGIAKDPQAGEANDKVLWTEAYIRVDADGDGTAELRKFTCIGSMYNIVGKLRGKPVRKAPFSACSPYPEAHSLIGQGVSDRTMDMQLYKSSIWRAMSDSLALHVHPRLLVTEGSTNIADAMNTAIGNIIRQKKPGDTAPMTHEFVGQDVLPVLAAVDDIIERRTGQNKGAQGLDSDALQSSTAQAVGAAVQKGAAHVELICRVIAEELVKPLMQGMYDLFREYQPKAEVVRINGEWVEMDPATWDTELEMTINVGLGTTDTNKKIGILMAVAQDQATIFEKYGPSNPVVTLKMIRDTKAEILALNGFKESNKFYMDVPANWQPPPPPPDKPSPEEMQVQGELAIAHEKTQRELAMKQAELTLKQQQQQFDNQLALAKLAQDSVLRRYAIDAQFKSTYTQQQMDADAADTERQITGHMDAQQQAHSQQVDAHDQAMKQQAQQHAQQLAEAQQAHDQQMAQQQAATAAQAASQGGAE